MKKIYTLLIIIVSLFGTANAQEITAPEVDSLVLAKIDSYRPKLEAMELQYPTLTSDKSKAKLAAKYDKLQAKCNTDIQNIYAKYINVDGVVQRVFTLRTSIDKESLKQICENISPEVRSSDPYVKSLEMHINSYQVAVGDTVGDFKAITSNAHQFNYGEFRHEKDVLLIFGDVQTMPLDVRMILQVMYKEVDLSKLEFVSFMGGSSAAELKSAARAAQIEWLVASDFRGDHSPLRIAFGVSVEPTLIYISKGGAIEIMESGLSDVTIDKIKEQSYK